MSQIEPTKTGGLFADKESRVVRTSSYDGWLASTRVVRDAATSSAERITDNDLVPPQDPARAERLMRDRIF